MPQDEERPLVTVASQGAPVGGEVLTGRRDRKPWRWAAHRGAVAAVVGLLLVTGTAGWLMGRPRAQAARAAPVRPSATLPVPVPVPVPVARAINHDLTLAVSVGHVRIPGKTAAQQIDVLSKTLGGGIGASFAFRPEVRAGRPGSPRAVGVLLEFDHELSPEGSRAFVLAVGKIKGASGSLGRVPGTTVDVVVPIRRGAPCVRNDEPAGLFLAPADMDAVARAVFIFNPGVNADRAYVSYTGPHRSLQQLKVVGQALAHSCGAPLAAVTYTRHVAGGL